MKAGLREARHYREVALLHQQGIAQGFLSTLGPEFLALLYRAIDAEASAVLLVREEEGRVVGFVAGAHGLGPVYRSLLRHPLALAWSLRAALLSPRRLLRMLEVLRYGTRRAPDLQLPQAELLSLAVEPAWRRQGVAEALYRQLAAAFRAQGTREFRIVVGDALAAAQAFYLGMGARPVGRLSVHAGTSSTVYVQATEAFA